MKDSILVRHLDTPYGILKMRLLRYNNEGNLQISPFIKETANTIYYDTLLLDNWGALTDPVDKKTLLKADHIIFQTSE